ncbi:hypothetical protein AKJ40_01415 [candidate division MSBL1 archaeon SCGC-AAA259M10]|uniref:Tyr recombinase domain-containing protein n=2 Tax=candidate division MSBL1 TaxID=215777 RepID=A0A133U8L7_9EURY|nr:hypothetical protein AKJ61_00445 [candidate division MSBL1 archaeon SCGC-AAA259B11]KXB00373.1 hypothetical protein AKJ40_01415 [candidate division MSBL1 archaeon SCGC-AAA259M10]
MLNRVAEKADIDKPVNPHHFRHSRATFLANRLTESQMCEWFGWVQGSDRPSVRGTTAAFIFPGPLAFPLSPQAQIKKGGEPRSETHGGTSTPLQSSINTSKRDPIRTCRRDRFEVRIGLADLLLRDAEGLSGFCRSTF